MKNKIIRIVSLLVLVLSVFGIGYTLYANYQNEHAGDKIPENKIKKEVYKSFDKYDFINLKSLKVLSTNAENETLDINYEGEQSLNFKLVDVYNHHIEKEITSTNNHLNMKLKDFANLKSRYDLLTSLNGEVTKLALNNDQISMSNGFGIIDNAGLEISFNKIVVDEKNEFKIFFDDVNYYRKSIGKKPLTIDEKISAVSQIRTKDEVGNKTYNFHYSSSTGFANAALINGDVVNSDCGKKVDIKDNKFCNITYKDKKFSVNIHNNDFEQITRGILFAHLNLQALKESPIHNRDLVSESKSVIGGAFNYSPNSLQLVKEKILMYGPKEDHTDEQASSAYINNNFSSGIKDAQDQESYDMEFLNTAFSFFLI